MKLFWKIFFTTVVLSALCIVVSGGVIIHSNFRAQIAREVEVARAYGEMVSYTLASEYSDAQRFSPTEMTQTGPVETISHIAYSVSVDRMSEKVLFAVLDGAGETLFTSLPAVLDKDLLGDLDEDQGGWTIRSAEGGVYLQTLRPAVYGDALFYIETLRDVTPIYAAQRSQYETLVVMLAGMIALVGLVTFAITRWLLGQVGELTAVTRTIADGDLSRRAVPRGRDELSLLADNFNRMAEHLEGTMTELKAEAARKERFVGAFSHELKTPLTSIIGYADLLRRKEMDPARRHTCADYIFTEGQRLETLSMRLLDLMVLQNQTLQVAPVPIHGLLEEVLSLVHPQLTAAGITLRSQLDPAVIPLEGALMKTVFLNLLDNARKAIRGPGTIAVTGEKAPGGYTVRIRDTGRGMDPTELHRITEAFYMVDRSRSRSQGGAGLGLSICDEILKRHGFSLSFDSQPGRGTTVTVTMGGDSG